MAVDGYLIGFPDPPAVVGLSETVALSESSSVPVPAHETLSESWSLSESIAFAIPGATVDGVKCRDLHHVRIQFSNEVLPSALKPEAYRFASLATPTFNPTVKSVRYVNGRGIIFNSLIELTLHDDLSPGIEYEIYISGVQGVAATSATFLSYSPNWPAARNFQLWDFVPTINKAEDQTQDLEKFFLVLQDQLDTQLASIDNWSDILDSDRADEAYLDAMLADLGNPFTFEDIYENDKRLLLRVLVQIYKKKGTDDAIRDAIRLFMGFDSQINLYRDSGAKLGKAGTVRSRLDGSFVLGGGGPFDFALTVATTEPAGRPLTSTEKTRIERIVSVVKPVMARFIGPVFSGLPGAEGVQISGNSSAVTISWAQGTVIPDYWRVYYRLNSGTSAFNTARYAQVSGGSTSATISTPAVPDSPGTTYYFVVVAYEESRKGFRSEVEVRNNLAAPTSVVAIGGVRTVALTWGSVAGATSYKVYKTLSTTAGSSTPVVADFAFEVLGGSTGYVDAGLLPGQTVHYCVVARVGDSEGFFSSSVTGTAI